MRYIKKFEMMDIKLKTYPKDKHESEERETIDLGRETLMILIAGSTPEYTHIENEITGSDPEDGGADHIVVFQRNSDDRYFEFEYTDWDINYNRDDFPTTATEVFPRTVTKTIYV